MVLKREASGGRRWRSQSQKNGMRTEKHTSSSVRTILEIKFSKLRACNLITSVGGKKTKPQYIITLSEATGTSPATRTLFHLLFVTRA